ncbi:unnamed protein product [Vitrella brassicaformis CCMP3155]|uniref:EndoU domain-containing protein n=2 Tax=Vitrella brassicaformis TaxID=1169539 RepID=A0A0G4GYI5_VITBC|nr:unnamed protein product [Vitrella brassicaformis CCMP3155]|eukprot:CEM36185.1 unnamed protein product [Vitrella brassicaformis CCMP3155]
MEGFARYVASALKKVQRNIEKCASPSPDQLEDFLETTVTAIRQLTAKAPDEVKDTVVDAFRSFWHVRRNEPIDGGDLSVDSLLRALEALHAAYPVQNKHAADGEEGGGARKRPLRVAAAVPTDEELDDLSLAVRKMWQLDDNRLTPNVEYRINLQGGKRVHDRRDMASDHLIEYVSPEAFERPTVKAFMRLLDNYVREAGVEERVSKAEKREVWDFLHAIGDTGPMQYLAKYVSMKGVSGIDDLDDLLAEMHRMWFSLYRRETRRDSSGFEHVFLGEEKDGKTVGFHNWIQFYLEERKGRVDYRGYVLPRRRGRPNDFASDDASEFQLVTIQFKWEGDLKGVGSMFVGTSPEFEMAVYSLLALLGRERLEVSLPLGPDQDNVMVEVTVHTFSSRYGKRVSTAYPSAVE